MLSLAALSNKITKIITMIVIELIQDCDKSLMEEDEG